MSDRPGSSCLQVLFEAALQDYERQTGIALSKHPLAEQLQNCDSIESVTAVLREQTQAFSEFRGNDKVLKPLKKAVSVLYNLSAIANFGQDICLVRSSVTRCSLSNVPHLHHIAFPACESNTHRPRRVTLCMYLY
jgi:fungal STAND N-terminal Goodbye domain